MKLLVGLFQAHFIEIQKKKQTVALEKKKIFVLLLI